MTAWKSFQKPVGVFSGFKIPGFGEKIKRKTLAWYEYHVARLQVNSSKITLFSDFLGHFIQNSSTIFMQHSLSLYWNARTSPCIHSINFNSKKFLAIFAFSLPESKGIICPQNHLCSLECGNLETKKKFKKYIFEL